MCDSMREYMETIFCSIGSILDSRHIDLDYRVVDIENATLEIKELLNKIKNNQTKEYEFVYEERIAPNWQYGSDDKIFHYGKNKISIIFYINFHIELNICQLSHCSLSIEQLNDYDYDKIAKIIKNIFGSQQNCFIPNDTIIQEIVKNTIKNSQENQGKFVGFATKKNDRSNSVTLEQYFIKNESERYSTKKIMTYKKMEL